MLSTVAIFSMHLLIENLTELNLKAKIHVTTSPTAGPASTPSYLIKTISCFLGAMKQSTAADAQFTEFKGVQLFELALRHKTLLAGVVIKAEQGTAEVGADLILERLQDISTYTSKNSGSSAGASLCIPPFCAGAGAGAGTVSGSYNNSKVLGDYASVSEQTGIQAGDGGFRLKVKGHTDLTGAVITSSQHDFLPR